MIVCRDLNINDYMCIEIQITNTFVSSIYVSILFGVFSSVSGLYLSYFFNLPSGPTMSMVATFLFVVCFFVSKLKKTKI